MTFPDERLADWVADFKKRHHLADLPLADDPGLLAERTQQAREYLTANVEARYVNALPTQPEVQAWVAQVLREAVVASQRHRRSASVQTGPSLLLLGPTGSGKTTEAYGALRVIAACGLYTRWRVVSAPDLYAEMGPRHGVDTEVVFERVANTPLLVLDDLAALPANTSLWESAQAEKINYRLVDRRYKRMLPTLFTSNVPAQDTEDGRPGLTTVLGDRVASRLREMAQRVALKGPDRRRRAA